MALVHTICISLCGAVRSKGRQTMLAMASLVIALVSDVRHQIKWHNDRAQVLPRHDPLHIIKKLLTPGQFAVLLKSYFCKRLLPHQLNLRFDRMKI